MLPLLAFAILATAAAQDFAAMDLPPAGFHPRYFSDAPVVVRRDGPPCKPDSHRCIDIQQPNWCCSNDQYCYIKPDGTPWCCPIGSDCDSSCSSTAYQCLTTITPSSGATPTASPACCGRRCKSTSFFLCEPELGGNCCPYGATCGSDGACRATRTTLTSASLTLTPIDPGCTATSQHACADGGGCCDNWNHCTVEGGKPACAAGNPSQTSVVFEKQDAGLSTGAKAGIGAGVAIGACLLVGVAAWMCVTRRKKRQESSRRSGGQEVMSETETESRSRPLPGLAQDYFGPDAVDGPFTERDGGNRFLNRPRRGVPLTAESPNDITAPVEIDSRVMKAVTPSENELSPTVASSPLYPAVTPETTDGRFELYGTEVPTPHSVVTPGSPVSISASDRSPRP